MAKVTTLQNWMDTRGVGDEAVAAKVGVSRVQVSRIRRKVNGASIKTAQKLQALTGIPWHAFVERAA